MWINNDSRMRENFVVEAKMKGTLEIFLNLKMNGKDPGQITLMK